MVESEPEFLIINSCLCAIASSISGLFQLTFLSRIVIITDAFGFMSVLEYVVDHKL